MRTSKRYRALPADVDAIQWRGDNLDALKAFVPDDRLQIERPGVIRVRCLDGWPQIPPDGWVIRDAWGDFGVVSPLRFERTYGSGER